MSILETNSFTEWIVLKFLSAISLVPTMCLWVDTTADEQNSIQKFIDI